MSKQAVYRLEGMSCMGCASKFEQNIREIETVSNVELNFGAAKVTVHGDASVEQLEKAGAFDGITVYPEDERREMVPKQPFWKSRGNITTAISVLLIIVGYTFYFQLGEKHPVTIGVFGLSILIGGLGLFKTGLKNLVRLEFDMMTLMTIAVIGAVIIGEWAEGAVVVFLFALSEVLETYSMDKARESIHSLINIAPNQATIKRGEQILELDVKDIQINDIMLIKPGQKLAMDGEVLTGESSISQAAITGESIPVHKVTGDEVFAGTINEEGSLEVLVTKLVEDTTISKIVYLVEEAQAERAPSQQFIDVFAKYYTPAIMFGALLVAVLPPLLFQGVWSEWVYMGLAVLVVGCPCALVISTPVAIVTAIGNAARNGVLIKGGIHLEETGKLKVIAFDKTGTLTEGKPVVKDVIPLAEETTKDILSIAAAIESFSQHPLASTIISEAKKQQVQTSHAVDFQSITGKGAKATINEEVYFIGNPLLFEDVIAITNDIKLQINNLQKQGKTVMLLGNQQEIKGLIAVTDQVRSNSKSIIQKLYQLGIKQIIMLTGDNKATGEALGTELGLSETQTDLLPEDKLNVVKELKDKYGKVAMIGDGINDAPALASATVGIAMGGAGTDTALETADIALMADDLDKLPYTISLSRKTLAIIKQNIAFAMSLKIIALLLVIPGLLTLWLAVVADVGATLIVVLNSMRLMKVKNN